MPPGISIITVYYNNADDMLRLAASMKKHLAAGSYEWIVADNASAVNISSQLNDAIYLRLPSNQGFGAGCNKAAEKSSAPVLFFVNPDCEFVEDPTEVLLNTLKDAAIAGPKVLYPSGDIQLSFGPFLSIGAEVKQKMLSKYERTSAVQNWLKRKKLFRADYVSGCALMIRADVFWKLNGFDQSFFLYNEDVDLCKRAHELGHAVIYNPGATIVHEKNTSVKKDPEKQRIEYRKSQIYYYHKHHGKLQNAMLNLYHSVKTR